MESVEFFFVVVLPLLLIGFALAIGRITERRHLRSLAAREPAVAQILVTDLRSYAPSAMPAPRPQMVVAEVVLAADYFKSFVAGLKKLIGGELRTYEKLMYRARAEALMRLKEIAAEQGYNALCNLRLETANIAGTSEGRKNKAAMCAVIASATAYRMQ